MKYLHFILIAFFFVALVIELNESVSYSVNVTSLNVRDSPSGEIVTVLSKGELVKVKTLDSSWAELTTGGWVAARYLTEGSKDWWAWLMLYFLCATALLILSKTFDLLKFFGRSVSTSLNEIISRDSSKKRETIEQKKQNFTTMVAQVLEDRYVTAKEAISLLDWCESNAECVENSIKIQLIADELELTFKDGLFSVEEERNLFVVLSEYLDSEDSLFLLNDSNKSVVSEANFGDWQSIVEGKNYFMHYTDGEGQTSEREIEVVDISDEHLEAFCTKRKAPRTFRIDRISSLTDCETGEVLLHPEATKSRENLTQENRAERISLLDVRFANLNYDFLVIDVETANNSVDSICQIGLAAFSDGILVAEWCGLVDPEVDFDVRNISIHGLCAEDVSGSPAFSGLHDFLSEAMRENVIVSHGYFDRNAVLGACKKYGLANIEFKDWLNSQIVVKRAWAQFSRSGYGLENVANHIGYKYEPHDALEDAKAAGAVVIEAQKVSGNSLLELTKKKVSGKSKRDKKASIKTPAATARYAGGGATPISSLIGVRVACTGTMWKPRDALKELFILQGGSFSSSVTKRTDILVLGAGGQGTRQHQQASELVEKGGDIKIIGEDDLRKLLSS